VKIGSSNNQSVRNSKVFSRQQQKAREHMTPFLAALINCSISADSNNILDSKTATLMARMTTTKMPTHIPWHLRFIPSHIPPPPPYLSCKEPSQIHSNVLFSVKEGAAANSQQQHNAEGLTREVQ
jgi:hypothetical protein